MNLPKMIKDLAKAIYTEKTARENLAVRVNTQRVGGTNILFDSDMVNAAIWGNSAFGTFTKSVLGNGRTAIKAMPAPNLANAIGVMHGVAGHKTHIVQGEIYTLSLTARASVSGSLNYVWLMRKSGGNHMLSAVAVGTEWQRVSITFQARWTNEQAFLLIGCNMRNGYPDDFWFEFHSVKLEVGNTATDWSPSPADLQMKNAILETEIAFIKQRLESLEKS